MGSWPGTLPRQPPGRLAVIVRGSGAPRGWSLDSVRIRVVLCVSAFLCESSLSAVAKTSVEKERVCVLAESSFSFEWGGDGFFLQ